jgi:hypothetical protein
MDSRQIHASAALPPGTHWIRGSVNPRAGLDNVAKRKFSTLLEPELRPLGRPALNQSLSRLLLLLLQMRTNICVVRCSFLKND